MTIWPVGDARVPNLPFMGGVSRPVMPRSARKPPISPSSSRAQITMTWAIGAWVIHVLAPLSR